MLLSETLAVVVPGTHRFSRVWRLGTRQSVQKWHDIIWCIVQQRDTRACYESKGYGVIRAVPSARGCIQNDGADGLHTRHPEKQPKYNTGKWTAFSSAAGADCPKLDVPQPTSNLPRRKGKGILSIAQPADYARVHWSMLYTAYPDKRLHNVRRP